MIKISHLTKLFDKQIAVDDVSFEVGEGETLVLLGTSGCGKTTTLRMLNRLIEPDSGTIEIDGIDIRARQPHELRRQMGYVIQETGLFPHYTVGENIAVVPRLLRWEPDKTRKRTLELLAVLRLPENCLHQYPGQLSGGQRQRVGLARALAANPSIVLMDEPLGALDPITRVGIRREFLHLEELQQKTILLVTHDIQEAFDLGDRICLMDQGRVQQIGTPKELLLKPANSFVAAFLADQRFALQLRIFTLLDLCPYLSSNETLKEETNFLLLEPQICLSDAWPIFSDGNDIGFQVNGNTFRVGFESVMAAFHQLIKR